MVTDSGAVVGVTVTSVRAQLPDGIDWLISDNLDGTWVPSRSPTGNGRPCFARSIRHTSSTPRAPPVYPRAWR